MRNSEPTGYWIYGNTGRTPPSGRSPDIRIRPARASDAEQITTFSRCIASFQAEGPCFAPVPEAYLEALDKGFAELTEDEEAEILVAETKGVLAGIAVLYPPVIGRVSDACGGSRAIRGRGEA